MKLGAKRPPKRYTTRQSILDAIDHEQICQALSMSLCDEYEHEMSRLKEWFARHENKPEANIVDKAIWHDKFNRLKFLKNESEIRHRAMPRYTAKLNSLKALLAEFDTEPMAFLEDTSVVVKK